MSGPGPKAGSGGEQEEFLWVAVALCIAIVCWLVWAYARNLIVWFMFGLDLAQLYLLTLFVTFGTKGNQILEFAKATFDGRVDPFSVTGSEILAVSEVAGVYFRTPFALLIVTFAVIVIFRMKGKGISRSFSLAGGKGNGPSLALYQSQQWQVITPSVLFDPNADDPEQAPSKTPAEWLRDNRIRLTEREGLDVDTARKAFEAQLGDPWEGVMNAKPHIKTIAVLCALNAKRDKKARDHKEALAVIWATKGEKAPELALKYLEPFLADKKIVTAIDKYGSKHAYTTTAMFRLLDWARRQGGVFASAEFRWLKPIDRTLWYTLNNCGRRAFLIEGAGPVSHYLTEAIVRNALVEPHVDQAVLGLEDYLEIHGIDDLERHFYTEKDF